MQARPNVFVGVFGLIVFLVTSTYLAVNWRDLTDTQSYEVQVKDRPEYLGFMAGQMGANDERSVPFGVDGVDVEASGSTLSVHNLTRVALRVTWTESVNSLDPQARGSSVQAMLKNPSGKTIATSEPIVGGTRGITMDVLVRDLPNGAILEATGDAFESRFRESWPDHKEDMGQWNVVLRSANGASSPGLSYHVTFDVTYYWAEYSESSQPPGGKI